MLFSSYFLEKMLLLQHHSLTCACLSGLVWKLQNREYMYACVPTCMYNRVFTLREQLRSIVKSVIYLEGVCLLFRMACILADDRAHTAEKAAALHIAPSPTYPKVSEPYTTWISTFKLHGWVTLQVNSNPIKNHGPIQTNQSPKSDNSLSKGQNVDAEKRKKKRKKAG